MRFAHFNFGYFCKVVYYNLGREYRTFAYLYLTPVDAWSKDKICQKRGQGAVVIPSKNAKVLILLTLPLPSIDSIGESLFTFFALLTEAFHSLIKLLK